MDRARHMRCGLAKAFPNECTSHLTAGNLVFDSIVFLLMITIHKIPMAAHEEDRSVKGSVAFQKKTLGVPMLPMEIILS